MGADQKFLFFLETERHPVDPDHPAWSRLLPCGRSTYGHHAGTDPHPDQSLSVGRYFQGIRSFFEGAGRQAVASVLERRGLPAAAPPVVRIFLSKHGAFYHPARVEADCGGSPLQWVVNVAVSPAGRSLLLKEFEILKRLRLEFTHSFLPEVYVASEVDAGDGRSLALFMGEWLSGYHEFHLARDAQATEPTLVIWDPESGRRPLDPVQSAAIYRQSARILTSYFNLSTFEEIGDWHHAAGDFVARTRGGRTEVRLITVRDYRPLFRSGPEAGRVDIEKLLQALLLFMLKLCIRTRLDRLEGTGDLAWSGPAAVEASVSGFLAALSEKEAPFELPLPLERLFRLYLASCSTRDLRELCSGLASTCGPAADMVRTRIEEHVRVLAQTLERI